MAKTGDRIAADTGALSAAVARGEGSIGGFLTDKELWDDLHETHRLLKWKGWRLMVKTPKNEPTRPE